MISWRQAIDDLRKEIRTAKANGNQVMAMTYFENILDELNSIYHEVEIKEISGTSEKDDLKDFFKSQREMINHSYEHAKQYANIIVIGGYAGLFTIWSFTKEDLEKWQVLSIGFSILISFSIFLVFELYSSYIRTTQVIDLQKELESAEKLNELPEEYGKSEQIRLARYLKIWPIFYFSAVGFALVAALLLGYSFVVGLI